MDVELLGTPGVRGPDGVRREVAGRQQALLALLALHAPRPVASDLLIEALWGEDLPADPANALQQRISSLRKVLDPQRSGGVLVTVPGGYALRIEDEHLDARRAARLAARGAGLLAEGDPAGALIELDAALGCWAGDALAGVADEWWAQADAQRLAELRLTVAEDRVDAALGLGQGAELLPELAATVARNPLRERSTGQLMLALCRDGRQSDALEVYDRTRRRLAEELGVDPGPTLQTVYRSVLDQDLAPEPTRLSAPSAPDTRADNLPAPTVPVVGREDVLARVDDLLSRARLVTLTGPGGVGKTTVALEAARRRPRPVHGTWWVDLTAIADAAALPGAVASALGVIGGGLGGSVVDAAMLADALADRRLLLVLDDGEPLLDAVATLLERILAAAPGVTVLVTSRQPLALPGEHVWSLPALPQPAPGETDRDAIVSSPAVRLLIDRARAHDPWFDLHAASAPTAAALVRALDGLPLAIELAAAQLRTASLPELLASVDGRLPDLEPTGRHVPERHRTLRATLDLSWERCDASSRSAWAALAVCAGSFTRSTAERLLAAAGEQGPAAALLGGLVDRSLLTVDARGASARYRMLNGIRAYGLERLDELGRAQAVHAAHADVVAAGLTAAQGDDDPARFGVALDELAAWLDDARVALSWAHEAGERARVQRLAGQLGWLWLLQGLAGEGRIWLDRGLGPPASVDPAAADPRALLWASGLRLGIPDPDGPRWAALALAAPLPPADRAVAGAFAAVHAVQAGRVEEARARLEEAREVAAGPGGWPAGFCDLVGAQLGRLSGRLDEVRAAAERALARLTDPAASWARAYAIDILIDGLLGDVGAGGVLARVEALAREGLALCADRGLPELEARLRLQLGRVLHERGDTVTARRQLEQAVALAGTTGPGVGLGFALLVAGRAARERGDLEVAEGQLREAVVVLDGVGIPYGAVEAETELALTVLVRGAGDLARPHAARALHAAGELGAPGSLARALEVCGAVRGGTGDRDAAVALWGAAQALRRVEGVAVDPSEERDIATLRRRLRDSCGADVDAAVDAAADLAATDVEDRVRALVARFGAAP